MNGSKPFKIDLDDLKAVGLVALAAAAGAAITVLSEWVTSTDFGALTPVVQSVWSVVSGVAFRWIRDNSKL